MEEVFLEKGVDSVVQLFIGREFDVTSLIIDPMPKAFLEKIVDSFAMKLGVTSLKMIDPIPARVLNLVGKVTLYCGTIHFACKGPRKLQSAHILL